MNFPPPRQRGQKAGQGLPGTACAPDLFSRIDGLQPLPQVIRQMPVRNALGFGLDKAGQPGGPFDLQQGAWAFLVYDTLEGPANAGFWRRQLGTLAGVIFLCWLWAVGWVADQFIAVANIPAGCDRDKLLTVRADILAKQKQAEWVGGDADFATRIDTYARDYLCPTVMVTASDATAASLAGEMDDPEWLDYCKANALCEVSARIIRDTQRFRVGIAQVVELWRRDLIGDDQVPEFLRRVGVIDTDQVGWIERLAAERPGIGDVVRRAQLGVYNEGRAARLGLTGEQDALPKPGDNSPSFAKGVNLQSLRDAWAAHWSPLDVQTAFDLYRRAQAGLLPPGVTFDLGDVETALEQAAIPPGQRQALLATITAPLNRRQLKQLYDDSIVDETDVVRYLMAGGLDQHDATLQTAQWAKLKPEYVRKRIGGQGAAGYVKLFAAGELGTTELLDELQALGLTGDEAQMALVEARAERQRRSRSELVRWLKTRYVKGDVSDARVQAVLIDSGLDAEDVASLLKLWRTELEVSSKSVSAGELLSWHCQGLLSDEQLAVRLANLNYEPEDIARMVGAADIKCWNTKLKSVQDLLAPTGKKLSDAQRSWAKIIGRLQTRFGDVKARTRTNAGRILSVIKSEIEGAPPPAKSLAGRAAKQGATTNGTAATQQSAPVATTDGTTGTQAAPGGGGSVGGASVATAPAPPVIPTESSVTPPELPPSP
jgi:hypothetical protein